MALSDCAKSVLAQMGKEALKELKSLISTAKDGLTSLKTSKQALSENMDITLVPLKLKKEALETAVSAIRGGVNIIPQGLILQCPDVGAINTVIEQAVSGPLEAINNMIFDINRLLSQKSAANAEIAQIDTSSKYLDDLSDTIDEVLNELGG